jgi:hypothetical protein
VDDGLGALNGRKSPGGAVYYADRLRQLQVPIVGDDACESAYGIGLRDFPYRPAWLLCAGTADGRTGACFGDSGGPLVVERGGAWLDVGIVLGGDSCAGAGYYDIFTRVDRVNAFVVSSTAAVQPDPVAAPRIVGRLRAGRRVRCIAGRWRGAPSRLVLRWRRLGSRTVVDRGRVHRVDAVDARRGVRCSVTASSRGGRVTAASRALRPARRAARGPVSSA